MGATRRRWPTPRRGPAPPNWPTSAPTPRSSTSSSCTTRRAPGSPRRQSGETAPVVRAALLRMRRLDDAAAPGAHLRGQLGRAAVARRYRIGAARSPRRVLPQRGGPAALPVGRTGPGRLGRCRLPRRRRQSAGAGARQHSLRRPRRRALHQRPRLAAGMPGGDRGGQIGPRVIADSFRERDAQVGARRLFLSGSDFRQPGSARGDRMRAMVLDDDTCYRAVSSRDPRFDGRFFTAVKTTGIYCRPICPARTPLRKNVRFFACAAAAEEAGFRPCRRCRPDAAPGTPAWIGPSAIVSRAVRLIERGALDEASVDELAGRVGVGGRQLRRLFTEHLGTSPLLVARSRRAHFARLLLDATIWPMTQVAQEAGFRSLRRFNEVVLAVFHRTPSELRRRGGADGPAITLRLAYRPPYDWPALVAFLRARAIPGLEGVGAGGHRRTVESGRLDGRP